MNVNLRFVRESATEKNREGENGKKNNGMKEDVSGCETNCNYFFIQIGKSEPSKSKDKKGKK